MLEKTPIGHIHNVPVYGRLPQRFEDILATIEAVTNPDEWKGLACVLCCDDEVTQSGNIAGGQYLRNSGNYSFRHNDGTLEPFYLVENEHAIYLEAGLHISEYWCAFDLLHELGHHNDGNLPIIAPTKKAEIFAHLFALDRVNETDFQFENETPPVHFEEAKDIWERKNIC